VFFLDLDPGLNMISLPLMPQTPYTAKRLLNELGATVVIRLDGSELPMKFAGFTRADSQTSDGFDIEGGKGYIVNMTQARAAAFVGAAWSNPPLAPSLTEIQGSNWAFVLNGNLEAETEHVSPSYTVIVTNLNSGVTASDVVPLQQRQRFDVVWADLNRQSVVTIGDVLRVEVIDAQGQRVLAPIEYVVTPKDIENAFTELHLHVGEPLPRHSALLQNFPNPFNPETWIPFQLSQNASITLTIYDAIGAVVRTIDIGQTSAGTYVERSRAIYWDGRNNTGERVASGIYFYQLQGRGDADFTATRKMMIVK
jgi:hypothetical protein